MNNDTTTITLNDKALAHLFETLGTDFQVEVTAAALNRASQSYIKNIAKDSGLQKKIEEKVTANLAEHIGGYTQSVMNWRSAQEFKFNDGFRDQASKFAKDLVDRYRSDLQNEIKTQFIERYDTEMRDNFNNIAVRAAKEMLDNNKDVLMVFFKEAVKDYLKEAMDDQLKEFVLKQMQKESRLKP